jgi:hypothetical protein
VNTSGVRAGPARRAVAQPADSSTAVQRSRRPSGPRRRGGRRAASASRDVGAGHATLGDLDGRERPGQSQQVGHALGVAAPAVGGEPLELGLDLREHLGVEQLAQLGTAQQLGQQALVERQGGGPALGDGESPS